MSDALAEYVQSSRTSWLRHFGGYDASGSGWHFCFAGGEYSPAAKLRLYTWGYAIHENYNLPRHVSNAGDQFTHGRPSTEQFFGGNGQTQKPFNNIVSFASEVNVFCTDDGAAYACGNNVSEIAENANGLGSVPPEKVAIRDLTSFQGGPRNTARRRNTVTRIIGEGGNLIGIKFTAASSLGTLAFCLLDNDGAPWFCGRFGSLFADLGLSTGPLNSLAWPTKVDLYQYESPSGSQTTEEPLRFAAICSFARTIRSGFYGLTKDGKLLFWKGLGLFDSDQAKLFEVTGFVSSVAVTAGGSGYTSQPVVTFSAPQHPEGVTAEGVAVVSGGVITDFQITQPGWGYTSAPTVTVSATGFPPAGSGASLTASLFSGTWGTISSSPSICAATDSSGKAYFWTDFSPKDATSADSFGISLSPLAPRNQDAAGYKQIDYNATSAVLLTNNGSVDFFGTAPDGTTKYVLTRLTSSITFTQAVALVRSGTVGFALLSDSGDIYTYGRGGNDPTVGRGLPAPSSTTVSLGKVDGDAKWTRVFGVRFGFVACRDESFDEYGNRIDPIPPGLT